MLPYELSRAAENDLQGIVRCTAERWGASQARKYSEALAQCTTSLATDKGYYRTIPDLYPNMRVSHCQHHYIFGLIRDDAPMLVVAILHERMDIIARLQDRLE
jgi:toxin ParE1/3/4